MTDIDQIDPAPWSRYRWGGEIISVDGCDASDFTRDDVAEVLAWESSGDRWDGDTCGLVRLKDGRFVAWEADYGPTGDGFNCDAYGGDADIVFGRTAESALSGIGEVSRAALTAMLEKKACEEGVTELAAITKIREMGLDAFCETYAIGRTEAGGLISLKYNQIESPMHEECVADCRGLVVKASDPTQVVAMAYRKFWNLGEKYAAPIDWASARVMEKLDGSLITMYWHEGRWCVASSGHPTAGGNYNRESEKTFADAFWEAWEELATFGAYELPIATGRRWYAFEFCAPGNRIVVKYDRPRIVLHGARHMDTLEEYPLDELAAIADLYGWECVKSWPAKDAAQAVADAALTDPLALEGFVVVDKHFNRVKVKNPRYVDIHHLRGNRSPRAVVELWKAGETGKVLAHFPEMKPDFDAVIEPLESACRTVYGAWLEHRDKTDRKEFALAVKDLPFSSVLFRLHSSPANDPMPLIREMNTAAILRGLGLKEAV